MLRPAATLARAAAALARAAAVTACSITSRSFLAPLAHEARSSDRDECKLCGAGRCQYARCASLIWFCSFLVAWFADAPDRACGHSQHGWLRPLVRIWRPGTFRCTGFAPTGFAV